MNGSKKAMNGIYKVIAYLYNELIETRNVPLTQTRIIIMNTTFPANNGDVTVSFAEAAQLYAFCDYARIDLRNETGGTINMVIGALTVGTFAEVHESFVKGILTNNY